jgi:hypothetical protein
MGTPNAHPAATAPLVGWTSFGWFRVLYVACIVALSVQAMHGATGLRDHRVWLPALEILGALLLLGRRVQRVGLAILLAVYLIAAAITLHMGHLPIYLLLYAGTAIFLVRSDR